MTGFLLVEALERFHTPEKINGGIMVVIAFLGLCVNLLMLKVLGGHGHSHGGKPCSLSSNNSHGHSHESHGHSHESHDH